ncbi:MAG TPA: bifunctional diaminohydroxyphosphoribosylaminopyrimidine deaminase/5-amino-6-(5-phosphoribosylamino)uracil reductase RibD [Devosia sp.]|nr:bifunctional diaminohydroxyphosphoribosylaminopyrimidine deaminase/5-amino-6-(5-phosphoribosylamino)uracil reductase RibD [Devosia sp.]
MAFRRAMQLAGEYEGATAPNPPVGCVLLDEAGHAIGAAAHQRAGQPHAEAMAIAACRAAGLLRRLHTVVVTLEPCNHTGRTPPCTQAILATPAREIWIGARDPNLHVAGGGAERLRENGCLVASIGSLGGVEAAELAASAERLIAPFAKQQRTGLPWVTVKQALDQEGGMIPVPGQKTFTSTASLRLAHLLRRRADAILTGSGTVLADNPLFTVRHVPDFPGKIRRLIILDRRGRVPPAYLEAVVARGMVASIAKSIPDAFADLGRQGAFEVLVEAGPSVTRAIIEGGWCDEHVTIHQDGVAPDEDQVLVHRYGHEFSAAGVDNVLGHH